MLGKNWLRANRIIWDFAKEFLIVNGEVFDMILEEKSQELKRRKWLEKRKDEDENEIDNKEVKKIKCGDKHEVEVINRIWAIPLEVKFNVNWDICVYSAAADECLRQNDIRYPCYLCGPSTSVFSRARDLMRHSVSNHDLFPSKMEQGKHYVCDGRDLIKPSAEQYERYKDGSHRDKKKLEENEKSEAERRRVEVRTKAGEKAKKEEVASTSREVDLAELMRRREEHYLPAKPCVRQDGYENGGRI